MTKHSSYQKIPHNLSSFQCPSKLTNKTTKWAVLEKVHGSNFSIYVDPDHLDEIRFAKRTGFLEPDENFYGYSKIKSFLEASAKSLASALLATLAPKKVDDNNIAQKNKSTKKNSGTPCTSSSTTTNFMGETKPGTIIIFGELFGGFYPAQPSLWKGPIAEGRLDKSGKSLIPHAARAVQEGIYYSQFLSFMVFDIVILFEKSDPITQVQDKDNQSLRAGEFLDYPTVQSLCAGAGFFCSKPLFVGPFQSCIEYPLGSNSGIPGAIGLEKLPSGTNVMEGIVVRPVDRFQFKQSLGERPILKIKDPKFVEVSMQGFDGDLQESGQGGPNDESDSPSMRALRSLVNFNRAAAVRSKYGDAISQEELMPCFIQDVFDDFYASFPSLFLDDYEEAEAFIRGLAHEILSNSP